jgi:uncharacterized protein YbjQ (UPF0145 family)
MNLHGGIGVRKRAIAVVFFLATVAGCAALETSEATHMLSGAAFPPIAVDAVSIYLQKPDFQYTVVGVVEARGMGFTNEARDQELAVQALKREAASIGANGVIISGSSQDIAGVSKYGTSTERRIKGVAIRYP